MSGSTTLGQSHNGKGIGLLMLALLLFTGLDTTAKYLGKSYPTPMLVWVRYLTALVFMSVWLIPAKGRMIVTTKRPRLQFARGVVLGLSTLSFFSALALLPIAEASAIASIAPILVTLMAVRYLGEKAPRGTTVALIVSFLGVLLIVRPGGGLFTWAVILPLLSATFYSLYQLLTRKVAHIDDGYASWYISALIAFLVVSLVVPFFWVPPKSLEHGLLFCMMGLLGGLGHLCLVRAYQWANASTMAPFIYLQIAMALLAGWLIFGTWPDAIAMIGMAMIITTGVLLAIMRHRESLAEDGLHD